MVVAAYRKIIEDSPTLDRVMLSATSDLSAFDLLSARELEVSRLVAKGFSNKEVALFLEISHWTVAAHLKATFLKLGVRRRSELAYMLRRVI
ncbi:LuxR C-terminal-related transcriptional regulator [Ruegeria sp. 2205SS24-7]|uniref:response regulator transcription factor n=1 Tax=Ruegeria discodermiae TaxID=3064389 RepID=UPI0027421036|nr:LuxR C-terminal-related transcriptional regulator [Ruegeria sp. 2205SS24-7]MDP5219852.1 LuxR C-terminal-related transcriptional regulator [Ruegeria sp. 2205SS24-7]